MEPEAQDRGESFRGKSPAPVGSGEVVADLGLTLIRAVSYQAPDLA